MKTDAGVKPKSKIMKWVKRIGLVIIGMVVLLGLFFLYLSYGPHEKVQITLPFAAKDDSGTGFIPMGEVEQWHNASVGLPDGHPGMDFQWNKETEIVAIGDGLIIAIYKNHEDKYIVEQALGLFYRTTYQELNGLAPDIRVFSKVKKGQTLGHSGYYRTDFTGAPKPTDPSPQIHWDFARMTEFRTCPLEYFDKDARKRLEAIWERVKAKGEYKKEYPDICNGAYKNQESE